MSISDVNLYRLGSGAPSVVVRDEDRATFDATEPGSHAPTSARAVQVDGAWYTIAGDCPAEGYRTWDGSQAPQEAAKERIVMSLSADDRALLFPGFSTRAERQAKHVADAAEAQKRASARMPPKPGEEASVVGAGGKP